MYRSLNYLPQSKNISNVKLATAKAKQNLVKLQKEEIL